MAMHVATYSLTDHQPSLFARTNTFIGTQSDLFHFRPSI